MRWLPFIAIFLYVYIEISIFIQVAHVLGVLLTLVLVIFTSVIGMSLVRNQGFKNFVLRQQKMAAVENPAAEMIKSVSLIIAGLLLLLPGFFTDFLGLLLFMPPVQKHLTVKLMPAFALFSHAGGVLAAGTVAVILLMVSTSERMMTATALIIKTIARINGRNAGLCGYAISGVFRFGRNSHNPASMISA